MISQFGALALSLAMLTRRLSVPLTAVVSPACSSSVAASLRSLGVSVVRAPSAALLSSFARALPAAATAFVIDEANLDKPPVFPSRVAREITYAAGHVDVLVAPVETGMTLDLIGATINAEQPRGPARVIGVLSPLTAHLDTEQVRRGTIGHVERVRDAAYEMAQRLWREEGLLVGLGAAAAFHVAYKLAETMDKSQSVVVILTEDARLQASTLLKCAVHI